MRQFRALFALLVISLFLSSLPAQAQPVQLSVQTPTNGSTVGNGFSLTGTATPGSTIEVSGDAQGRVITDPNGYWQVPINPYNSAPGQVLNLTVRALGPYGGASNPVGVRYALSGYPGGQTSTNDGPLLLSVNSPTNGATLASGFSLQGTGTPGAQVQVTGSLNATGTVDQNGNWSIPIAPNGMAAGTVLNLSVSARDGYGRVSDTTLVKYALSTSTTGYNPSNGNNGNNGNYNNGNGNGNAYGRNRTEVSILSPNPGSRVYRQFTLTGTATPGSQVEVSGDLTGTTRADQSGNWSLPLSTNGIRDNNLNLHVRAQGPGRMKARQVELAYELARDGGRYGNSGRQLQVLSPSNGTSLYGPFTLNGSARPGARVDVTGSLSGTGVTDANGTWAIRLNTRNLNPGTPLDLTVTTRDQAGNQNQSQVVNYTVR